MSSKAAKRKVEFQKRQKKLQEKRESRKPFKNMEEMAKVLGIKLK